MGFTNLQHQWFLTQHKLSKKTRKKSSKMEGTLKEEEQLSVGVAYSWVTHCDFHAVIIRAKVAEVMQHISSSIIHEAVPK